MRCTWLGSDGCLEKRWRCYNGADPGDEPGSDGHHGTHRGEIHRTTLRGLVVILGLASSLGQHSPEEWAKKH